MYFAKTRSMPTFTPTDASLVVSYVMALSALSYSWNVGKADTLIDLCIQYEGACQQVDAHTRLLSRPMRHSMSMTARVDSINRGHALLKQEQEAALAIYKAIDVNVFSL